MKDRKLFLVNMATIGEVFDKQLSDSLLEVYWRILEPFDDSECLTIFKRIVIELKFFPKPAEMVSMLRGTGEERAINAWLEALGAVKRFGNYQSVKFSDPAIHSVIQSMGGWPQFALMSVAEEKWKQKEFERLYQVLAENPRHGKHPEYLPGEHEIRNEAMGYDVKPQIGLIGFEREKVRLIK